MLLQRNKECNNPQRPITAWVGLWVFLLLIVGDFISFSTRVLPGIPLVPIGIISYILIIITIFIIIPQKVLFFKSETSSWLIIGLFVLFWIYALIRLLIDHQSILMDYYLVLRYLVYFLTGLYIGKSFAYFSFRKVFSWSYFIVLIIMLILVDFRELSFLFLLQEDGLNYLRLAESFLIIGLGFLCFLDRSKLALFVFISAAIMLFFINSRFALAAFLLIGALVNIYKFGLRGFTTILFSILIVVLIISGFGFLENLMVLDHRVVRLLMTPEVDTSLLSRQEMTRQGMEAIRENWFLGDFRGQVKHGGYGSYMHNILSYWRQYGVIAFALICSLLLVAWSKVVHFFLNGKLRKSEYLFGASFLLFTSLGLILAKSFVYTQVFMSLGIIAALFHKSENLLNHSAPASGGRKTPTG